MDRRLRIILELVASGFSNGARGAASVFKGFVSGVVGGAKSAGSALKSLAEAFFFVQNAVNSLFQAGRWLFDLFIKGAGDVAKLEAKLTAVVGSADDAQRVIDLLRKVAQDTGAPFEELAHGASLLAVAARDATGAFDFEKFQRLTGMLQRMQALRPDVPVDRLARGLSTAVQTGNWQSLEMFLDVNLRQLVDMADAAEDVANIPNQVGGSLIFVQTKTDEAAKDALKSLDLLDEALNKAGATAEIVGNVAEVSGMERFVQILEDIARIVGKPLFARINKELSDLADWLQEHPEEVERFATLVGDTLAGGLDKLFQALENIDWQKVAADFQSMLQNIQQSDWSAVRRDLEAIGSAIQFIADAIDKANQVIETARQLGVLGEQGVSVLGPESRFGELTALEKASLRQAQGLAPETKVRLEVHVTSDDEKFKAYTRQIADESVTEGLNATAEEIERGH